MSKRSVRLLVLLIPLALIAAACTEDDKGGEAQTDTTTAKAIDYAAIGLWDDGPCDESKPPLVVGLMTTFESGFVSLGDQAKALEASAKAFNKRGGANGSCIQVHNCDDGASADQAIACVREIDQAGVMATINDQGTAGQKDVSEAMQAAHIPRVASNVTSDDWGDQNAYPLDPSGTGGVFLHPKTLSLVGPKKIGIIRVDLPAASQLKGLLEQVYADDGITFPYDVGVPSGTTDYSQFVIGAEDNGAEGVTLNLGEQEAVQVVRAAQQLNTKLKLNGGFGTFSRSAIVELGDFSKQMVFDNAYPPATFDLPVYEALRDDLAASGEEALQPDNMRASPMRSWIGLYALLWMIRENKMTEFTRDGISAMLQAAKDVPMLDMFGGENWTPDLDHPGIFKRAGMNHWGVYTFDPKAEAPDGVKGDGNFVETGSFKWDDVMCGTIFGAPEPCA